MKNNISITDTQIADFCKRNNIRRFAFFGSVLRDDFTPESDIDILVEFDSDAHVGFFELYDMEQELSQLLNKRKVDINTPMSVSKHFRYHVLKEAEVHYDRT